MEKHEILATVIIGCILVYFGYVAFHEIDCAYREQYWNDKGFFIDNWGDWNPLGLYQCEYEAIPK